MRYHYTTMRMTKNFKTVKIPNSGKQMEKPDLPCTGSGNLQPLWKSPPGSCQTKHAHSVTQQFHSWEVTQEKWKLLFTKTYTPLFTTAPNWTQLLCPSSGEYSDCVLCTSIQRILLSSKKKWTTDIFDNLGGFLGHYAEGFKRLHMIWFPLCKILKMTQSQRWRTN